MYLPCLSSSTFTVLVLYMQGKELTYFVNRPGIVLWIFVRSFMPKKIDIHTILRWIYSSMLINVVVVVHRNRYYLETEILVSRKCKISKFQMPLTLQYLPMRNHCHWMWSPHALQEEPVIQNPFLRALTKLSKVLWVLIRTLTIWSLADSQHSNVRSPKESRDDNNNNDNDNHI